MNQIPYSKELIDEVKALYPKYLKFIQLAENGDKKLGTLLNDEAPTGIMLEDVLSATSLEELQKEARISQRKVELYNKWRKEYNDKLRTQIE